LLKRMKKAVLMVAGKAAQSLGAKLESEQEIVMAIADMVIETYVAESCLLRAEKLMQTRGEEYAKFYAEMAKLYLQLAVTQLENKGKEAIACFAKGDEMRVMLMGLKRFTKHEPLNQRDLRRSIAARMISENKFVYYPF
jgi:hypothetical protein